MTLTVVGARPVRPVRGFAAICNTIAEQGTRYTSYLLLVLTATHARTRWSVGARWPLGWDLGGSGQLDLLTSMIFVKRIGCTWSSVEGLELPNDRFETPT